MLNIDGSYGEGGGQILRYAVALSVYTKKPVEIVNIRSKRPKPGLRPQHLTAISCLKALCNANTDGLYEGSTKLTFNPGDIKEGEYSFNIGTAGSITLFFQACILGSLNISSKIKFNIKGGTDVKWSPSWIYFTKVFLQLLKNMGINTDVKLIKRGYYPKGGGEASLTIFPIKKIENFKIEKIVDFKKINGVVHISNLSEHISKRIKHIVIQNAIQNNIQSSIYVEKSKSICPGVGLTLWSKSDSCILGSAILGEKGKPAESIGIEAFNQLLMDIKSNVNFDIYAIDQILPYMVISKFPFACSVRKISNHTTTALWLLKHFFKFNFKIKKKNGFFDILIN